MDGGMQLKRDINDAVTLERLQLLKLKQRADAVRRSLLSLLATLQYRPEHITWDAVLDKFQVVSIEIAALQNALQPQLQSSYLLHPSLVDAAMAPVLPQQLASRALPEMEVEEQELQDAYQAKVADLSATEQYMAAREWVRLHHMRLAVMFAKGADGSSAPLDPKASDMQAI